VSDTLIWITGATQGIGLGLARHAPYAGAKIVNISRRTHPDYETVLCDMADPDAWDAVCSDFAVRLAAFSGRRAIFINNANVQAMGPIGVVDPQNYRDAILANCAAPLVLAEAFVREALKRPEIESGLVLLSSDSAAIPLPGMAAYCASKVAAEHWAEVVRRERAADGKGPWVVAVRPGAVITPPVLASAALDPAIYPGAARVKESLKTRVDIDEAGRRIWAELPPKPGVSVISFGEHPTPERSFGGAQLRMMKAAPAA
jgi:NAD(P)-dependent dehydrogenase (short-subunit alcohol dehydrogenase family)